MTQGFAKDGAAQSVPEKLRVAHRLSGPRASPILPPMRPLLLTARTAVLTGCAVVIAGIAAETATADTTQFASPAGSSTPGQCTDVTKPCSLQAALTSVEKIGTVSLAPGKYDMERVTLPAGRLHLTATDPQNPPALVTSRDAPVLSLTLAQPGWTFDHLVIGGTEATGSTQPAVQVAPGTAATFSSMNISGRSCIVAPGPGQLLIEDSMLSSTISSTCLQLGADSTVRRSTISVPTSAMSTATTPPVLSTGGVVEDTTVAGGLFLSAPTAVARRVKATGIDAISGVGLVTDSLAKGSGMDGSAISANGTGGGLLTVVNSTAINPTGPAVVARESFTQGQGAPNNLVLTNSIARGTTDLKAELITICLIDFDCERGQIDVDHSDFVTADPPGPIATRTGPIALITDGAGNITGDLLFVDPAGDDYHLRAGSPAIDAGAPNDLSLPADLDGSSRVEGSAPDLGAFESSFPPPPPTPPAQPSPPPPAPPPPPHARPVLSSLKVSPSTIRARSGVARSSAASARVTFALSAGATVKLSFAKAQRGRVVRRTCKLSARGNHNCTRYITKAVFTIQGRHGVNTVAFSGNRSLGKLLPPGSYRLTATPTDTAHAVGLSRTVKLTVIAAGPRGT